MSEYLPYRQTIEIDDWKDLPENYTGVVVFKSKGLSFPDLLCGEKKPVVYKEFKTEYNFNSGTAILNSRQGISSLYNFTGKALNIYPDETILSYLVAGARHREDGPAVTYFYSNKTYRLYYLNGVQVGKGLWFEQQTPEQKIISLMNPENFSDELSNENNPI